MSKLNEQAAAAILEDSEILGTLVLRVELCKNGQAAVKFVQAKNPTEPDNPVMGILATLEDELTEALAKSFACKPLITTDSVERAREFYRDYNTH